MDKMTLTLNSPITEEQWDAITDVDFEHTNEITFHTKHGKEVKFVKASAEPKKGKWIAVHDPVFADTYYCSACKEEPLATDTEWVLSKFCPNCGASMSEGEEDD